MVQLMVHLPSVNQTDGGKINQEKMNGNIRLFFCLKKVLTYLTKRLEFQNETDIINICSYLLTCGKKKF